MDHETMVRYLVGELGLAAGEVDRTLRAFEAYLEAHRDQDTLDLGATVKWIVERTMLPWRQVERTLAAMLDLSAKLDQAVGLSEP